MWHLKAKTLTKNKIFFSSSLTAILNQKTKVFPDYIAFISHVLASPSQELFHQGFRIMSCFSLLPKPSSVQTYRWQHPSQTSFSLLQTSVPLEEASLWFCYATNESPISSAVNSLFTSQYLCCTVHTTLYESCPYQ